MNLPTTEAVPAGNHDLTPPPCAPLHHVSEVTHVSRGVPGLPSRIAGPAVASSSWPAIPGYEILRECGRGGMGVVYQALQSGLNRLVALKMIRDDALIDPEFRQRFQTEAQAVARLQHPNIVQIFEIGMLPGNRYPYFSLEFVDGGDLGEQLKVKPLEPPQAAELVRTLAGAMQAHEHGIVHRDLKPANILLTRDGQPKITDFGLAKQLGRTPPGEFRQSTVAGMVLGTPEYMAPEQARGDRNLGPAIDIYGLGVILYEMLTGRCPFEGRDAFDTIDQVRTA